MIGWQKEYRNVPSYVSNDLGRCTSALPAVLTHLPSESLSILQLLRTALPQVTESFQCTSPHDLFSFQETTHTLSAVLSACSTTSIPTYGMCSHTDRTFQPAALPRISVPYPTEFSSKLTVRLLRGTPIMLVLRHFTHCCLKKKRFLQQSGVS